MEVFETLEVKISITEMFLPSFEERSTTTCLSCCLSQSQTVSQNFVLRNISSRSLAMTH